MIQTKKNRGFSLLELMVVVAILGILSAIAYTSYANHVMRSNRADAQATLNDIGQRLQRCYTTHGAFNSDNCGVFGQLNDSTIDSAEGFYEISISNEGATTYTLTATAVSPPQTNDRAECQAITLTHQGRRGPDECW